MFYLYRRTPVAKKSTRYERDKHISFFGCRHGLIPRMLKAKIPPNQNEPYGWHIDVLPELNVQPEYRSGSLIIDLKPRQHENNVSLYEVLDVWGWSRSDWTKVLLRLNGRSWMKTHKCSTAMTLCAIVPTLMDPSMSFFISVAP